ncbi:MAG: hypothetical protein CL946_09675 [Ectothiorhodospiraceae bacterium]|nr:hypothetical protein [Ectothiorhodospiraceae bacterium]
MNWKRFSIALAVGTLVSAFTLAVLHAWYGGPVGKVFVGLADIPTLTLAYFIIVTMSVVFIGVPSLLILNRLRLLHGSPVLLVGAIIGAGWAIPMFSTRPSPYLEASFFAFGGFVTAAVFWLVYSVNSK